MTVFLNLYILVYLVTLIKLNYLLTTNLHQQATKMSLNNLITYILKFNKLKSLILLLILSLTGLPPFLMFFIKFNYLINCLYKTNVFLIFIIFLIFFLNMLFYIQPFFSKNLYLPLSYIKNKKQKLNYSLVLLIVSYLALNIFSVFIFSDLYYIINMIIIGNI